MSSDKEIRNNVGQPASGTVSNRSSSAMTRMERKRSERTRRRRVGPFLMTLFVLLLVAFVILGAVAKVSPLDRAWNSISDAASSVSSWISDLWPFEPESRVVSGHWIPEGKKSASFLIVLTKEIEGTTLATGVAVSVYDSESNQASVFLLPNDLYVTTPGSGSDQLNNLVEFDGDRVDLMKASVENLLGIEIDRYILATDRDLRILLNQLSDKWPVTVKKEISFTDPSLDTQVEAPVGSRNVSANLMTSLVTYDTSGNELLLCDRGVEFSREFLRRSNRLYDKIGALVKENLGLLDTDASAKELEGAWKTFALLNTSIKVGVLPVVTFEYDTTKLHQLDRESFQRFIMEYVHFDPEGAARHRHSVAMLNGNGTPGIGLKAASLLDMNDFEIVNSTNADSFDHPDTIVFLYSKEASVVSAGERIVSALGVGRIEFKDDHDVADITVLIGADFNAHE